MFKVRLAAAALGALGFTIVGGLASANADVPVQPIGPNQFFSAEVNFSSGSPEPAVIQVDCPGPIAFLGQTGHPLPGQSVEVTPSPTLAGANVGFTGPEATEIGAFFGVVPPTPTPVSAPVYVPITDYDVAVPIPTSLTLPCFGSSQVTFVPLPNLPGVRDATVPVEYFGTCPSLVCPV